MVFLAASFTVVKFLQNPRFKHPVVKWETLNLQFPLFHTAMSRTLSELTKSEFCQENYLILQQIAIVF